MTTSKDNSLLLIILSFAAVYIIWGSTYLFIAFTVEALPPFILSTIRFTLASSLLFGLTAVLKKYQTITKKQFFNAVFAGILFLGFGTGGVAWALQFIDSGFTALVISGQPLTVVLMMWAINRKRPATQSFAGIFLGMFGMYLLVSQKELMAGPEQWKGVIAIFFCMVAWGFGSIFVSKSDMPKPQMANNAIQMMSGGVILFIFSLFFENSLSFDFTAVPSTAWLALSYLIVFGAAVAFSAFNYLLTQVSPEKVATSTYINPIIALTLGWYFRDELVTGQSILAVCVMFMGVFFINSTPAQSKNLLRKLRLVGRRRV
ncbi:MAG: EamA family transporter [Saprospiraceae bacterium]